LKRHGVGWGGGKSRKTKLKPHFSVLQAFNNILGRNYREGLFCKIDTPDVSLMVFCV